MSLVAQIQDGKLVESASQSSLSKNKTTSSNSVDKDSFLQLLVAQMQYQDPLEPTSNTEYISQYAQFTQVEEMQNMAGSMNFMRAGQLVGREVYIKTTSSSGDTNYVQGKVDYVVYENNKAYLSIDESLYSIDDLDTVVDLDYQKAYDKATAFATNLSKLTNISAVTLSDEAKIAALKGEYDAMTDYEKSFIASNIVAHLDKYVEKINELKAGEKTAEETKTEE
ncbi:MAG: flagellar hook capping protein [Lachnospiraceae bacterium]|nr:flagellar hook capping protein [Lachnospiraceae bacterium]